MVLITKKSVAPAHHRKRHGQHHKRGKHYDKSYWPYLPLLGIIGFGFLLNALWTPLNRVFYDRQVLAYATATSVEGLLSETNARRGSNGVAGLLLNSQLVTAAQNKANDMAARNYWSHATPDGREPWWFVSNAGYRYITVGENLAYGFDNSNTTLTGWMDSPGHRANILNASFRDVGFGVANVEDYQGSGPQTIVVAMYGSAAQPQPTAPAAAAKPAPAPVPVPTPAPATPPNTATQLPSADPASEPEVVIAATAPANSTGPAISEPPKLNDDSRSIARFSVIDDNLPSLLMPSLLLLAVLSAGIFIGRHLTFAHRAIVRGEKFIIKHPALDVVLVLLATFGILLTRSAGFIQ